MRQLIISLMIILMFIVTGLQLPIAEGADSNPPPATEELVFIHHSTGGHWLADTNLGNPYGGLGSALKNNNYFVSATNFCWGPDEIGSRTDIINWPEWFTGLNHQIILTALYNETGQNFTDCDGNTFGSWSRPAVDPGNENSIVLFKSCFPNSGLYGNPDDPPASETNDQ